MLHNASSFSLKLFSRLKETECKRIDFIWFFLPNWRHFFHKQVSYHNVCVAVNNWLLPNRKNFSFSLGKCKHFFILLLLYHLLSILSLHRFPDKVCLHRNRNYNCQNAKHFENFALNVMTYLPLINCCSWWFEIHARANFKSLMELWLKFLN